MVDNYEPRKSSNLYELTSLNKHSAGYAYTDDQLLTYPDLKERLGRKVLHDLSLLLVDEWLKLTPEESRGKAWSLPLLEETTDEEGIHHVKYTSHLLQYDQAEKPWMTVK